MKKAIMYFIFFLSILALLADVSFGAILVEDVKGSVAFKTTGQWQPLKSGMNLSEGTKISTGINSSAVIKLDNHTLTVKPLTMIKIYENSRTKEDSRTLIGLRRGTVQADVSKSKRIKTVFKVSTPVATSSVRGTSEVVSFGPSSGMKIVMLDNAAQGESKNGSSRVVTGSQVFQQKLYENLPENILSEIKGKSIVFLYDPYSTGDEKRGFDFFGSDLLNNPESVADWFDAQFKTNALVVISPNWPD